MINIVTSCLISVIEKEIVNHAGDIGNFVAAEVDKIVKLLLSLVDKHKNVE